MKTRFLAVMAAISAALIPGSNLAFAGWGAIAYNSSTGRSAEAHGYAIYAEAISAAREACGGGCEIINWEQNSCIAFATGGGRWGEAHGYSDSQVAVDEAISACGAGCAWQEWACD